MYVRLSDNPLFHKIAMAFYNAGMSEAEQMRVFEALRAGGVFK